MLHKYDKIDEAMAACVALEYPLVVLVHDKLPSSLYNAEEATRSVNGASSSAFPFLPSSYNTEHVLGSIGASSGNASATGSPTTQTRHSAATADQATNARLGYLMRPATLTAAAAADASVMDTAVLDGEELSLVTDFPLASVHGGAAQREAVLVTLLESRLGSVTLLHLIEAGTSAYESFSAAVPVPNSSHNNNSAEAPLPRVHVFFAPTVGLSPMVLHGNLLTPQNLNNCIQMGLLRPRNRPEGAGGAPAPGVVSSNAAAESLRIFFTSSVSAMSREYARSRQQQQQPSSTQYLDPSSATAGRTPSVAAAPAPAIVAAPATRSTGASRPGALAAAHLITVAGLPTSFAMGHIPGSNSGAPVAHGANKTIMTTPSMTLQTVWRTVEKHLEWAQHEMQQAQAVSMWNGVVPPKPGTKFVLRLVQHKGESNEEVMVVKTLAEANQVRLQDFPRNAVVQVEFEGWQMDGLVPAAAASASSAPSMAAPTPAPASTAPAPAPSSSAKDDYVCEGDVCRRRTTEEKVAAVVEEEKEEKTAVAPSTSTAAAAASSASTPVTAPAASIKLHCSLPNGKTFDVEHLNPATDTLQANVRPAVEAALGYSRFLFVCAYPPKRYSAEADEPRPLQEVGLTRSCALRVVPLDGPGTPNAASAPGQPASVAGGGARQMLNNAASSLLGMLGGRRPSTNAGGNSLNAPAPAPPPRRTYNSMAAMLAANEEAEKSTAMDRLRQEQESSQQDQSAQQQQQRPQGKKSNRYFGGGSTEYVAEDNDDNQNGDNANRKDGDDPHAIFAAMTPEQQEAFMRDHLRRVLQHQQRVQQGRASEEEGEGRDEGEATPVSEAETRYQAFQGQGRRLAGNAPPSSSENGSQPNPDASPDATGEKKNQ